MNKRIIGIEENLTPVKEYLADKGYSVESVDISKEFTNKMEKYDALVVRGMNNNFLGINDTNTKAVVIDAKGMTAEQVYNELESRLH
jgi:hypothetical protein